VRGSTKINHRARRENPLTFSRALLSLAPIFLSFFAFSFPFALDSFVKSMLAMHMVPIVVVAAVVVIVNSARVTRHRDARIKHAYEVYYYYK